MDTNKVTIPLDGTMDNPQERPEAELSWLAGCFESDGCFMLHKNNCHNGYYQYQPTCSLVNTDRLYLMSASNILKKHGIPHHIRDRDQTGLGKKRIYTIFIQGLKRCNKFLPVIIPYMRGIKTRKAEIMMELVSYRLSTTKEFHYGEVEEDMLARFNNVNQEAERILNDYTSDAPTGVAKI